MSHVWTLERPVYDIRTDSYWLVTGDGAIYRFSGPVKPSDELLNLLPVPTLTERRDVMAYLPTLVGLNTYVASAFAKSAVDDACPLTSNLICREALLLFDRLRSNPVIHSIDKIVKLPRPERCNFNQGYRGVYLTAFSIDPLDLRRSTDWFRDHYLTWAMEELIHTMPAGDFRYFPLELAQGTLAAVQENYNGVFLRLVVADGVPVTEADIASGIVHQVSRYYDISTDEMKTGPNATVMNFSVKIDSQ